MEHALNEKMREMVGKGELSEASYKKLVDELGRTKEEAGVPLFDRGHLHREHDHCASPSILVVVKMQGGALWRRPCGCSSHARMGGKGRRPARATGPRCRGDTQFSLAPSIGVFGFVPVWARSIFSSSRVVVRAWCLMPRSSAALLRRRCYASARGVRGVQGGVRARGAALWPRLLLRRWRVCCDCHGGGRAWRGGCAHGGCVVRALGAVER